LAFFLLLALLTLMLVLAKYLAENLTHFPKSARVDDVVSPPNSKLRAGKSPAAAELSDYGPELCCM